MSTVVVGEQDWLTEVIEQRRALGQDLHDEVWEGVYHVAPDAGTEHAQVCAGVLVALHDRARRLGLTSSAAFNLGSGQSDYRVPDGGWFLGRPHGTYAPTALVVLEVLSPGDETYDKFPFFLDRGVEEVLVAHPLEHGVRCHARVGGQFEQRDDSVVFGVSMAELAEMIDWL